MIGIGKFKNYVFFPVVYGDAAAREYGFYCCFIVVGLPVVKGVRPREHMVFIVDLT